MIMEDNLIYLCTFGLDDPIRDEVYNSIKLLKYGTREEI